MGEGIGDTVAQREAALDDIVISGERVAVQHGIERHVLKLLTLALLDFWCADFLRKLRVGFFDELVGITDFSADERPLIQRKALITPGLKT